MAYFICNLLKTILITKIATDYSIISNLVGQAAAIAFSGGTRGRGE